MQKSHQRADEGSRRGFDVARCVVFHGLDGVLLRNVSQHFRM